MRSFQTRAVRAVLIIGSLALASALILLGLLVANSPGRPQPFLDAEGRPLPGSISEKLRVSINGVEQGMFVQGRDRAKPVLLFVHGGPGMPEHAIARRHPMVLEDEFVVCWWEQRGAGLSFAPGATEGTVNEEQLVDDTVEVARYLRARFGQEKIFLLGHSWGSYIGIRAAARAPELFHAYLGMAQVTRQLESERLAHRSMVEMYRAAGDERMAKRLERFPLAELDGLPDAYRGLRDEAMHELGMGTTRKMKSVVAGIFLPVMAHREYTLGEKIGLWRGKWSAHSTRMWNRLLAADVTALVPRLEVPVYLLHGAHDQTSSYALAEAYFEALEAPHKAFYRFEDSAHSPLFEEPEKMRRILREDVLGLEPATPGTG